jgi:Ice-binding-like
MANGGQPCNVYWLVGADSTLTTSTFQGNILAGGAASAFTSTGGTLIGRVLANGAVALTGPNIHGTCALVAQGGASCPADDDDKHHHRDRDKDRDHDKDKDKDHNKDDNKDHN